MQHPDIFHACGLNDCQYFIANMIANTVGITHIPSQGGSVGDAHISRLLSPFSAATLFLGRAAWRNVLACQSVTRWEPYSSADSRKNVMYCRVAAPSIYFGLSSPECIETEWFLWREERVIRVAEDQIL